MVVWCTYVLITFGLYFLSQVKKNRVQTAPVDSAFKETYSPVMQQTVLRHFVRGLQSVRSRKVIDVAQSHTRGSDQTKFNLLC